MRGAPTPLSYAVGCEGLVSGVMIFVGDVRRRTPKPKSLRALTRTSAKGKANEKEEKKSEW
jgi:hypothetical protein